MFDIAWSELFVIGVVFIVAVGPKELPRAMRTLSQLSRQARQMASEFRGGMNQMMREAELQDLQRDLGRIDRRSIGSAIERAVDPDGTLRRDSDISADLRKVTAAPALPRPAETVPPAPDTSVVDPASDRA